MSQNRIHKKEIDIGIRKVSNQNFSKIIALPKIALANCGNPSHFKIHLIQENDEIFIKLTPIYGNKPEEI